MSKKIAKVVKIQFPAGGAKPGPALAGAGIQMPKFCNEFNDKTRDRKGETVPVVITVYDDKSFDFVLKTAPAAEMILKAANVSSGSATPGKSTAGRITVEDLKRIAEYKMPDLNANDIDGAMRIIAGTAKNMGIEITGYEG